jgi:hypothetical protein
MISFMLCVFLTVMGLFQLLAPAGSSPFLAAGMLLAAAIIGLEALSVHSQKSLDRIRLASLEAQYAADTLLLNEGHKFNEEEREIFRERAHDIGILRARCGYIPKPNSFSELDYQASIRNGRI